MGHAAGASLSPSPFDSQTDSFGLITAPHCMGSRPSTREPGMWTQGWQGRLPRPDPGLLPTPLPCQALSHGPFMASLFPNRHFPGRKTRARIPAENCALWINGVVLAKKSNTSRGRGRGPKAEDHGTHSLRRGPGGGCSVEPWLLMAN